jgi:acetyl esterase/lipase
MTLSARLARFRASDSLSAGVLNATAPQGGFDVRRSIAYGSGPRRVLDLYRPRALRGAPAIIFYYGGRWESGEKELYFFLASALARRGIAIAVPDYRVYPEVRFPAFLEDAARAVHFVIDNAAGFGIDPSRIFLMGHSAGAHIAAMLRLDARWLGAMKLNPRRDLAGMIGLAGPYDFLPLNDATLEAIFGDGDLAHTQPISFVGRNEPPILLATGGADRTVSPGNTRRLAARIRDGGGQVTDIVYPRVGHLALIGAFAPLLRLVAPVLRAVVRFIEREAAPRYDKVARPDITPTLAQPAP